MKKILTTFLLLALALTAVQAEETSDSAPQKKRPTVGLVFSGGGAKGMAHIGVLKVIEELGIPVDYVAGTSIGSIIGGFYALGYNAHEMDSLVRAQDWDLLMKDKVDRRNVYYSSKEDKDRFNLIIPFMSPHNLREETEATPGGSNSLLRNMPSALVEGQNLDQLFTKMAVGYLDDVDFNDLPIPFACVAVDLNTKEEVVFRSGDVVTAIRASMSIPGYFAPVQIGDRYLVDGGMLNNLPVDVVKEMGADYVITIDLHHYKKRRVETDQTIPEMVGTMLSIMNGEKYHSGLAASDIIINPNTSAYGVLSFDDRSVDALVDSGRVAALEVLPQLQSLADHLKSYPDSERPRPRKALDLNRDSIFISQMEIRGAESNEIGWLLSKTDIAPGKWITGADMDRTMDFFYSTKCFNKASYDVAGTGENGYRLKINLDPERIHQAGIGFRFDSEEMASILMGVSLNKRRLFGPKLDWELELGTNTHTFITLGYTFRNLTRFNLSAKYSHTSFDLYDNIGLLQEEDKFRFGMVGTDRYHIFSGTASYQITGWRSSDIIAGVRYENYNCRSIDATSTGYNMGESFTSQTWQGFFDWIFDSLDDNYYPHNGLKTNLAGKAYYERSGYWFYDASFNLKTAIPLGKRTALIPQLYNRWVFGLAFRYYRNHVGGLMPERYGPSQMPFVGLNNVYKTRDRTSIARLDLRFNLFKQHYLTLMGNYMLTWEPYSDLEKYLGLGASYSVNTIVGPVQFVAHWSTLSKNFGFHFSLGYDF